MTYKTETIGTSEEYFFCSEHNHAFPNDNSNRHYLMMLDDVIAQGADCWDGDIPADIQAAAEEKQFNDQLMAYARALNRLALHRLADGAAAVTGQEVTGRVFNEETQEYDDVLETVELQPAIPALSATVEVTTASDNPSSAPTTEVVTNPLIVADDAERAEAQAIVDATPQPVIDAYNEE